MTIKEEPIKVESEDNNFGNKYSHPAFGMISHSRLTGGNRTLAGSDLKHNQTINIRIHTSTMNRNFHSEKFFQDDLLLEVSLSEHQWATFLSNGNTLGVPCTIEAMSENPYPLKRVPNIKPESSHEKTVDELEKQACDIVKNMKKELEELEQMVDSKNSLSKPKLREKIKALKHTVMETSSNIPYVVACHKEVLEGNIQSAKSEVEAYVTQKVYDLGLTELEKLSPKLVTDKTENKDD